MTIIQERIDRAFNLTQDLFQSLGEGEFKLKIPGVPSNTFAEQAWCIIGARESYLKALVNGKWSGFSCSVKDGSKKELETKLKAAHDEITAYLAGKEKLSDFEEATLMDLLEHEIQHHGQLIRFVYGNKLQFPASWNKRYTV